MILWNPMEINKMKSLPKKFLLLERKAEEKSIWQSNIPIHKPCFWAKDTILKQKWFPNTTDTASKYHQQESWHA